MNTLQRVTLVGRHVRLEPLALHHFEDLATHSAVPEAWKFMSFANLEDAADLRRWLEHAVGEPERGEGLPFALVSQESGRAVGSTSYYDFSAEHRRVEIGRTWLGRPWWRTAFNTEAKRLLFGHAFEVLGCNRVQLKTDARNERSQAAIARLGAVREGVLRAHMVMHDGHVRDTVMFSITAAEWPGVRVRLDGMLARPATASPA